MKALSLYISSLVALISLSSCTLYKNHEIRKATNEIVLKDFARKLDLEQNDAIQDRNTRGKDFSQYVQSHLVIEISQIKEITGDDYLVEGKVRIINPEIRRIILEMLSKMDSRTANAYNFGEALGLIQQQKPDTPIEIEQSLSIELHQKNGDWVK